MISHRPLKQPKMYLLAIFVVLGLELMFRPIFLNTYMHRISPFSRQSKFSSMRACQHLNGALDRYVREKQSCSESNSKQLCFYRECRSDAPFWCQRQLSYISTGNPITLEYHLYIYRYHLNIFSQGTWVNSGTRSNNPSGTCIFPSTCKTDFASYLSY